MDAGPEQGRRPVPTEGLGALLAFFGEYLPQARLPFHPVHRFHDAFGITGIHLQTGTSCNFRQRGTIAVDDGGSHGECLEDRNAEALEPRDEDEGTRSRQHLGQLILGQPPALMDVGADVAIEPVECVTRIEPPLPPHR